MRPSPTTSRVKQSVQPERPHFAEGREKLREANSLPKNFTLFSVTESAIGVAVRGRAEARARASGAMPSFPSPGTVTVCEINRDLITADSLSDDRAKETYGKILGMVFSPLPFQSEQLAAPSFSEQEDEQQQEESRVNVESLPMKGVVATLQGFARNYLKRLLNPADVKLLSEVDLHGVSWHQQKHIIAFISGPNQVLVRDFEDSECKDPSLLIHESQRDVKALEWRPNGGRMLSVACKYYDQRHWAQMDLGGFFSKSK
ncbi:hypothetical protein CRG98_044638 [Punica granatum]|uniref:Uncharacterized protein n=1 Tax=Punica granatum TaxID=22663 RepID=A0A2I0HTA3_PUNGR|nr:hypothetical protein CRG98_044638 [Punica granatum]